MALVTWLAAVYVLDNTAPSVANLMRGSPIEAYGTIHIYYSLIGQLAYPMLLGALCAYPFINKNGARHYVGVALLIITFITLFISIGPSVLPLPQWMYDMLNAMRKSSRVLALNYPALSHKLAVIALMGVYAVRGKLAGKIDARKLMTVTALIMLALLYIMVLGNYATDRFGPTTSASINGLHITQQVGSYIACVLCFAFAFILWLLGRIRASTPLSTLPAFALCILWLLRFNAGRTANAAGVPLRMFGGGGALIFGILGFSALYGLYRWEAHNERPRWNTGEAIKLAAWVLIMYLLDNAPLLFDYALTPTASAPIFANITLYFIITRVVFPACASAVCLMPFINKEVKQPVINIALIALPAVSIVYGLFPSGFEPNTMYYTDILSAVFSPTVFGAQSQLWPYLVFALIITSIQALRVDKKAALEAEGPWL